MEYEMELTEKLLTTFHLNSNERNDLVGGKVKLSIMKNIIRDKLQKYLWFPENWRPNYPFVGGLIELQADGNFKLYHKEEVSLMNYKIVNISVYSNFDQVVEKFLKITFSTNIDNVQIDYKS
jgi:hypothetical protein